MSFLTELRWEDLQRLRVSVKRIHMTRYPKDKITDHEADKIIEALGPEAAETLTRRAMDAGIIEGPRISRRLTER
jgi:hypothetical protein